MKKSNIEWSHDSTVSKYQPDRWLILQVTPKEGEPFNKVFATWAGGYLKGDYWRLNSGIESVEKDEDFFVFIGSSGSKYYCHKDFYGVAGTRNYSVLDWIKEELADRIKGFEENPYER